MTLDHKKILEVEIRDPTPESFDLLIPLFRHAAHPEHIILDLVEVESIPATVDLEHMASIT
jgi:hypothetical protein